MFCGFYLVKNHKIANNSKATKAREKINADLESSKLQKYFDSAKFESNKILLKKLASDF